MDFWNKALKLMGEKTKQPYKQCKRCGLKQQTIEDYSICEEYSIKIHNKIKWVRECKQCGFKEILN